MKQPPQKFIVRLPPPMHDLITQSAQHYRRSMNSDIVARLQHSFSGLGSSAADPEIAPPLHDQFESLFRRELSDQEERLLRGFRSLSQAKRDALVHLLS